MPFKHFWYPYIFESKFVSRNDKNIFLFYDSNPLVYNPKFLEWIGNKIPNSKLCIIFLNSFCNRTFVDIAYFRKYFSLIMSIDKHDAKKYGFDYVYQTFSVVENTVVPPITSMVSFVGGNKGREQLLLNCHHKLSSFFSNNQIDFNIVGLSKPVDGIGSSPLSYKEVMYKELSSKCLLEIVSGSQVGLTLRSSAAICYNKFLISNNKMILDTPWYNENVLYIESADDITDEFLNKVQTSEAKYEYNGEFSPLNVIKHIEDFYSIS